LLANYMHKQFGIGYQISGYFFLAIGWGYTLSCFLVHFTLEHFTNMRTSIIAAFFVGLFTMTYGASNILQIDTSMVLLACSLLVAGFANSHLLIPPMDEMIAVGQETVCTYRSLTLYSLQLKRLRKHLTTYAQDCLTRSLR
jgi:hypothetical protein